MHRIFGLLLIAMEASDSLPNKHKDSTKSMKNFLWEKLNYKMS